MLSALKRIERTINRMKGKSFIDHDEDGFIAALVGEDRKHLFLKTDGDYDVMAALTAVGKSDIWDTPDIPD